ncbi:hypothetical protein Tco_0162642 [Tanacetum coccineum]
MSLDCQLGIVAMWGEWEGFVKWLMECCRVEVWEQNRVLAGFGIGGKKVYTSWVVTEGAGTSMWEGGLLRVKVWMDNGEVNKSESTGGGVYGVWRESGGSDVHCFKNRLWVCGLSFFILSRQYFDLQLSSTLTF